MDDPPSVSHSGAMVGLGSQQRNGIRRESQIKYKFHADICKFLWEPSQTLHIHICITYACLESQCASDENVRCNSWENKLLLLNDCIITMHEIVTGIHILKRQPLYSGLNELIEYYSGMQKKIFKHHTPCDQLTQSWQCNSQNEIIVCSFIRCLNDGISLPFN